MGGSYEKGNISNDGYPIFFLVTGCASTSSIKHVSFDGDSALQNESIDSGNPITILKKDGIEMVMLVSSYDSKSVTGYVTAIYDKQQDKYSFYEEVDGKTEKLEELKATEIDRIDITMVDPNPPRKPSPRSNKSNFWEDFFEPGSALPLALVLFY